jgi:hypothetical protein
MLNLGRGFEAGGAGHCVSARVALFTSLTEEAWPYILLNSFLSYHRDATLDYKNSV